MSYSDPTTDIKARRAEQERIHLELLAGVNNLIGLNKMVIRAMSGVTVPTLVAGVVANHAEAEAFIAEGISDFEAMLDVQGIWGELDDA